MYLLDDLIFSKIRIFKFGECIDEKRSVTMKMKNMKRIAALAAITLVAYIAVAESATTYVEIQPMNWCIIFPIMC